MKTLHVTLGPAVCLLALLLLGAPLYSQNQSRELIKLADGVYAAIYSEFRMDPVEGNSVIVIGQDDALVLDSGRTPDAARSMIEEIRKLTAKPVRQVVNSHWHDDHVFGNQAYEEAFPGVQFIAHARTRDDMRSQSIPSLETHGVPYWEQMAAGFERRLADGTSAQGAPLTDAQKTRLQEQVRTLRAFIPKIGELRVVLPTTTFEERLTIHQGDREIRLLHPGPGNTRGDVALYLPQEKILATGDLLVHPVPFAYGSSIAEWVGTLKSLRALDADVIVPGHGPVMRDTVYLDLVIALFESLVAQVRAAAARGLSLDDTRKAVDLESFRSRLAGEDPVRRGVFADSIVRVAIEQAYTAAKGAR